MPRYEKYVLDLGPYQEGNLEPEEIVMDSSFIMTGVSVTLQVRDSSGKLIAEKQSADNTITISGQTITWDWLPEDFKRKPGKYNYELDFINSSDQPFATIGGLLSVNSETNKLIS